MANSHPSRQVQYAAAAFFIATACGPNASLAAHKRAIPAPDTGGKGAVGALNEEERRQQLEDARRHQFRNADAGDPFEQFWLAEEYERSQQFELAYKWFAIAARVAKTTDEDHKADAKLFADASAARDRVAARLSAAQIATNTQLAENWHPNRTGCWGSFWYRLIDGSLRNDMMGVCDAKFFDRPIKFRGGAPF